MTNLTAAINHFFTNSLEHNTNKMIECSFCGTKHVANTTFCDECGQYLVVADPLETESFSTLHQAQSTILKNSRDTLWIKDGKASSPVKTPETPKSQAPVICIQIGSNKRKVKFTLNRTIYLGRIDPLNDIFPDIDLTEDDRVTRGVSRRHLRIFDRRETVMIEDLGSFNGTVLNGEKLPPFLPTSLSDGDCLQLGRLKIKISFLQSEASTL